MPMPRPKSVDDYIASQSPAARRALKRVRRILRKAVPDAEEAISYGIAAFKLRGKVLLYYAGWRDHYSLYPASERLVAAVGPRLKRHVVSKGTMRFSLEEPVPEGLIERIARMRARELAERAKAKPVTRSTRRPR